MVTLLKHDDTVFDDAVVYASGHAYFGCEFNRCTIVLKEASFRFENCHFRGCIWHIDILLHDRSAAEAFLVLASETIVPSIPQEPATSPEDGGNTDQSPATPPAIQS